MVDESGRPEDTPPQDAPRTLAWRDAYNAAIQLHNHEFATLSAKTNAFLIVQSILIAAFITMICYKQSFPMAFDVIALVIISVAILYCFLHHKAGWSGAQAAFRWRRYLLYMESGRDGLPMTWFRSSCEHTHNEKKCTGWYSRLTCEACLFTRIPLPNAWLFTPSLLLAWWLLASLYVELNYWFATCNPSLMVYHQSPRWLFIIGSTVVLLLFGFIVVSICRRARHWWREKRE